MKNEWGMIPIYRLVKANWNYKKDDEEKQWALLKNIARNKQIQNLIIRELPDEKYEVINGNHRLDAFHTLEYNEVMCCNLGEIPLKLAQRIALETNETSFKSNDFKLAKLIDNIVNEFGLDDVLETSPFSEQEIKDKQEMLSVDWDAKSTREANTIHYDKDDDNDFYDDTKIEVVLSLPEQLHDEFVHQIDRLKKALEIDDDSLAIQAIVQHMAQISDEHILELELI